MKNQLKYTQDCLRTWKTPNLIVTVFPLEFNLTPQERERVNIELRYAAEQAQKYEELAHTIAGISGEILSELEYAFASRNQTNILEEVGDIQYHILIAAHRYGVDLTYVDETTPTLYNNSKVADFCLASPFKAVKYHAGEFIDVLKRIYIYKSKKFDTNDLVKGLKDLQSAIYRLSLKNGFTPEEAIEAVIRKLKLRYEDKFSVDEADNRHLKAEEQALEGK